MLENCNCCAAKAVEIKKSILQLNLVVYKAISIGINMQTQLNKLFQSKLNCNMVLQAVALLFYKVLVFELASSCRNIFSKVLLEIFGMVWRFWGFCDCFSGL